MRPLTRAQQIALYEYNVGIQRAREEYEAHPTACADWCAECIEPRGTTKDCANCKAARRMQRARLRAKDADGITLPVEFVAPVGARVVGVGE